MAFYIVLVILLVCGQWTFCSSSQLLLVAPNGKEVSSYVAVLYQNKNHVIVHPPIRAAISGSYLQLVCGFTLHERNRTVPVSVQVKDSQLKTGELVVKKDFSVSSTNEFYTFDISAFDCDSPAKSSPRVPVSMKVEPYEVPQFESPHYSVNVLQNITVGTVILRVHAYEVLKSATVCRYEISDPLESPFDINDNGVIALKAPLKQSNVEQHTVLRVTAVDCNVPDQRKASVSVNIHVKPILSSVSPTSCKAAWTGLSKHVDYPVSSGVKFFARDAGLQSCFPEKKTCLEQEAVAKITLMTTQTREKCEVDARSLFAQRDLCELNRQSIDLLHPSNVAVPEKKCKCCEDKATNDSNPENFHPVEFDGDKTYVAVPKSRLPADHLLGDKFSIHFWLKHGAMPTRAKEQIICNSDKAKRNRHHYSVFLHNCKLILLLRQEYRPHSESSLKHAEWRFQLSEVCDNAWHHYAISFYHDQLKLYVDGRIFVHTANNPQVMDDYVMHKTADSSTRLTVGACWHSGRNKYQQFLRGSLAGLVVLRQNMEPDRVLRCLNQCQEKLDFHAMSQMQPGMSLSLNSDMTMIEIKGHNLSEVVHLMRQIGYTNVKSHPTRSAQRTIRLETSVTCKDSHVTIDVEQFDINLKLVSALDTDICVQGANIIRVPNDMLAGDDGINVFVNSGVIVKGTKSLLDSCFVWTSPEFSIVESLIWPADEASKYGISGRVTKAGLIFSGVSSAASYEKILQQVRYRNTNPIMHYRNFNLTCSLEDGKYVSNELPVKIFIFYKKSTHKPSVKKDLPDPVIVPGSKNMDVLLDEVPVKIDGPAVVHRPEHLAHHGNSHHAVAAGPHLNGFGAVSRHHVASENQSNSAAGSITVIAISVGFVLFVLGAVIYRWRRSYHNNSSFSPKKNVHVDAESAEMEWDNTALNITVNPLERELFWDRTYELPITETSETVLSVLPQQKDGLSESECGEDFGDELDLDGSSSSCPEDDDEMDAADLLRQAQIASSEDELEEECHLVTGSAAITGQQLEWDDSSLPRPSPRRNPRAVI